MRFGALFPAFLAVAPAVVSAAGTLGFALGATNPDGSCKSTQDYEKDLEAIKGVTSIVRGYEASECNFAKNILPVVKSKGFKVIIGIWAETSVKAGSEALAAVSQTYGDALGDLVYAVTVGSESLYRKTITADALNTAIDTVKKVVPKIKVGTADSYTSFTEGSMDPIIKNPNVEILLVNGFPYWQGQSIDNSTASLFDDVAQALQRIQTVSGSTDKIEVMVGETGWPTDGNPYEVAIPTLENAAKYWKGAVCGILDWGMDVFAFEAFDEPNKPESIGLDGIARKEVHWGTHDAFTRKPKYDLSC